MKIWWLNIKKIKYVLFNYKKILIVFVVIISMILFSCNNTANSQMTSFETKTYESILIAKDKIQNFQNKEIKGVYNLIEDRENFVIINISDEWYVLAIDTYDEMKNKHDNSKMMEIAGWRYTLKATKGDIARAPDLLVDMVKQHMDDYKNNVDIELLNKALGLHYTGNI